MKTLKLISYADALSLFDDKSAFTKYSGLRGFDAIVIYENRLLDSAEYGRRMAIPVGEAATQKTVAELNGSYIGENGNRLDAVAYCIISPPAIS